MSRFAFFITVFLIVFSATLTSAQEGVWPAEERCADHAAIDAWSFDGTILAIGYGGLHGINAAWDTPRVVAGVDRYSGGRLSPNQRWYAAVHENVIYAQSFNHEHVIEAIEVYSTTGDGVVYSIPWQNSWLQMWGYRAMFWLDDERILYEYSEEYVHDLDELVALNPFDGTMVPWSAGIDILDGGSGFSSEYTQFPSPDFTRTIYYRYDSDRDASYWALYDVTTGASIAELNDKREATFAWLPDSSGFVAEIVIDDSTKALRYVSRDDEDSTQLLEMNTAAIERPQNMRFSPDGRYFAFHPDGEVLYIADMQRGEIFDTCLPTAIGLSWSPDGRQLAFLERGIGIQNVYILDLDTWSYRAVARHIVQTFVDVIIGWRDD